MSALDNLSPAQLGEHVRALTSSGKMLHDDSGDYPIHELAEDSGTRCSTASWAVEEHLERLGIPHRGVEYSTGVPFAANHYATEVPTSAGPHIVDLALRQYDDIYGAERTPWPLVEHRDRYLKRYDFEE